jgi:hypothetical protein
MRESLSGDDPGGMADLVLPQCDIAVSAEKMPLHADLFPIRARSLSHPRVLERQRADIVAAVEMSAVLPRRMGSGPPGEIEKDPTTG